MTNPKVPVLCGLTSVEPLTNPVVISDLNLIGNRPKTIMAFLRFMKSVAPRYAELVILGNLFDYWTGDDTMTEAAPIVAQLKHYTSTGHRVIIMRGNRDMLLGEDFAKSCGAELLLGPTLIRVRETNILFAHGDEWCTRDIAYQNWRNTVRDPRWQTVLLSSSLEERLKMIRTEKEIRDESENKTSPVSLPGIVERSVYEAAISAGAELVIHGHTHKAGAHVNALIERWVLPNWSFDDENHAPKSGYIRFRDEGRPQIQLI